MQCIVLACHISSVKTSCFSLFKGCVWSSFKEKPEEGNYSKYTAEMTNAAGSVMGYGKALL